MVASEEVRQTENIWQMNDKKTEDGTGATEEKNCKPNAASETAQSVAGVFHFNFHST